jgi:hypothetical protein
VVDSYSKEFSSANKHGENSMNEKRLFEIEKTERGLGRRG